MKAQFAKLSPTVKKYLAIGATSIGLVGLVMMTTGESKTEASRPSREESIRNVLTGGNTRRVSLDAMDSRLERAVGELERLQRRVEQQDQQLNSARTQSTNAGIMASRIEQMSNELTKLRTQNTTLQQNLEDIKKQTSQEVAQAVAAASDKLSDEASGNRPADQSAEDNDVPGNGDIQDVFETAVYPEPAVPPTGKGTAEGETSKPAISKPSMSGKIVTIGQVEAEPEGELSEDQDDPGLFLASGSILKGVILNGMDAPTNQNARKDPFPSLLRLQKEAILPNYFSADVRECFLIMSGYGDLSSERAYLRGEMLSCVREDGGVIEANLASYAVGEDGKAGIRGRVVSKQGEIIGRSLLAGFLSGAANAFSSPQLPSLNTNGDDQAIYQTLMSANALNNAAFTGASTALDRIAQYYIERAEGLHPIVEIAAGRQVEVIVTKGAKLSFKGAKG